MGMFEIFILRVHGKKHWIIQNSMRIISTGSSPVFLTKLNYMKNSQELNQELKNEIANWTNDFGSFIDTLLGNKEEETKSIVNSDTEPEDNSQSNEVSNTSESGEHLGQNAK